MIDKLKISDNAPKAWWKGDSRVEQFMPRIEKAIKRHIPDSDKEAFIDIYNRAYEAIYEAIIKYSTKGEK